MSTPATYQFIGEAWAPVVTTLYIHLDGDPRGAANYLRAMLEAGEGVSAVAFIRATPLSSLVAGHDVWPNTYFRYTLSTAGEQVRILAEQRLVEYEEGWKTIFDGPLVNFLNNQPGEMLHATALYEHGPVGFYTQNQLSAFVSEAMQQEIAAAQQAGSPNLAYARERVTELNAIHLAAFRLEEFGESVAA